MPPHRCSWKLITILASLALQSFAPGEMRASADESETGNAPQESVTFLSDCPDRILTAQQGWGELGLGVSAHISGKQPLPMKIAAKTYTKGLGTHASSEIVVELDPSCLRFESEIGIQSDQSQGTAVFEVWLDGRRLFKSGKVVAGQPPIPLRLDVVGGRRLRLLVTDGGDGITCDVAHWADARLIRDPKIVVDRFSSDLGVDIAPSAVVVGSNPKRIDGARNNRFQSFPKEDLNLEWELNREPNGTWTPTVEDGRASIGLRWLERRHLRRLALRLADPSCIPQKKDVVVQGWVMQSGGGSPGGSRWQGRWEPLSGDLQIDGNRLIFSIDRKNNLTTRSTGILKVRWLFPSSKDKPVHVAELSAWTDTLWVVDTMQLRADPPRTGQAELNVYNGEILHGSDLVRRISWDMSKPLDLKVRHSGEEPWKTDLTTLRLKLPDGAFAISVNDVLSHDCVWVKDFGVWAAKTPAEQSIANYRKQYQGKRTVLDRVRDMPDQTREQAWNEPKHIVESKSPTMLSLACDNHKFLVARNGQIEFEPSAKVFNLVDQFTPPLFSCLMQPEFGDGKPLATTRWLDGGWLPIPITEMKAGGITYRTRTFVTPYGSDQTQADAPSWARNQSLCVQEITVTNSSDQVRDVKSVLKFLRRSPKKDKPGEIENTSLQVHATEHGAVFERNGRPVAAVIVENAANLNIASKDGVFSLEGKLDAGKKASLNVFLPGWKGTRKELAELKPDAGLGERTIAYWKQIMAGAAAIDLPDPKY